MWRFQDIYPLSGETSVPTRQLHVSGIAPQRPAPTDEPAPVAGIRIHSQATETMPPTLGRYFLHSPAASALSATGLSAAPFSAVLICGSAASATGSRCALPSIISPPALAA